MSRYVLYCGHCGRQQEVSEGDYCIVCQRKLIAWFPDESFQEIREKWVFMCKRWNQKP